MNSREKPKIMIRVPKELKAWLSEQAAHNASSQTSEIVRAVRERMNRYARKNAKANSGVA
jgi:Arc-like DNA binding domain